MSTPFWNLRTSGTYWRSSSSGRFLIGMERGLGNKAKSDQVSYGVPTTYLLLVKFAGENGNRLRLPSHQPQVSYQDLGWILQHVDYVGESSQVGFVTRIGQ